MPKWQLKDGAWVPQDNHTLGDPSSKGISNKAPGFIIKQGEWKKDVKRRFDKPTEQDIKKLEQEDEEKLKKELDITPVIKETKRDLETGKIRVDPNVLKNLRGKKYDGIAPFTSVIDERGITHVIRKDKAPIETIKEKESLEGYYERVKQNTPLERVAMQIGAPQPGNLTAPPQSVFEQKGIQAIHQFGRDAFKGKTIP